MRQYDLTYSYGLSSDSWYCTLNCHATGNPKLTLTAITPRDKDKGALPATQFTYNTLFAVTPNTGNPVGSWNRLTNADNGQGGTVQFDYANIATTLGGDLNAGRFNNNRRVWRKTLGDGQGHTYPWTYTYSNPAYNSLGQVLNSGKPQGPNVWPNSATLYYNYYHGPDLGFSPRLVHPTYSEFRGHSAVIETDPNLNQTLHEFMQGDVLNDANCHYPTDSDGKPLTGGSILTNPCFIKLRDSEIEAGREYHTLVYSGAVSAGFKLSEMTHTFTVDAATFAYPTLLADRLTGLWRSFTYESRQVATTWYKEPVAGGVSSRSKTTVYTYDPADQGQAQYGDLTRMDEFAPDLLNNSVLQRQTFHHYMATPVGAANYIVGRLNREYILGGSGNYQSVTLYLYDGSPTWNTIGTRGLVTGMRKFSNVQPVGLGGYTLLSSDTNTGYDAYGNPTTSSTYPQAGTGVLQADGSWVLSAPGNGSTPRTTTTTYDARFRVFPTQIDPPAVGAGVLSQYAGYDWRMGLLTSITDANGQITTAGYDAAARLETVTKPGDQSATVRLEYHTNERPVRFVQWQLEQSNDASRIRPTQKYYDGLGRLIQTKVETVDGQQNTVVDQSYDGLGQTTGQSQPRYVNGDTTTTFYQYIPVPTGNIWTTSQYDALGRPTRVQSPDGSQTNTTYWIPDDANGLAVSVEDPNHHKVRRYYDLLGRMTRVMEFLGAAPAGSGPASEPGSGSQGVPSYTTYATTNYSYSPLDLLTGVTDQQTNQTTLGYDSLGRKTSMQDPDMGHWTYSYDPNGNLTLQTDARSQQVSFSYDALDRLTGKTYPTGNGQAAVYGYDAGSGNKGQRTSMTRAGSVITWQYDARGRMSQAGYQLPGLAGTNTIGYTYDSADRLQRLTYPGGETIDMTYDAGWRQTWAISNFIGAYRHDMSYNALNQPIIGSANINILQQWTYNSPMQRLDGIQAGTGASLLNRSYGYDAAGNVTLRTDNRSGAGESETFAYDEQNRLINWNINNTAQEHYDYDPLGNLSKTGHNYSYASRPPYNGGPHAVKQANGRTYTYDMNGNTLGDGVNAYTWDADNMLTSAANGGSAAETYNYDADGERIMRLHNGVTTYYIGGVLELDVQGGVTVGWRVLYSFSGQLAEVRSSDGSNTFIFGDALGSTEVASDPAGNAVSRQKFDPWGAVRPGSAITQTTVNYTGQRKDDTGLLYYHARYYDPSVARFMSADTIVPSVSNPQQFNRYSYGMNNPLRYNDPSGHTANDYYVFVQGCVSGCGADSEAPNAWGEYTQLLHQEYEGWANRYRRYGEELPSWTDWSAEHIRYMKASDSMIGSAALALLLEGIPYSPGSHIHLIGHSEGGGAIMNYFGRRMNDDHLYLDNRISDATFIDAPLGSRSVGWDRSTNNVTNTGRDENIGYWLYNQGIRALVVDNPRDWVNSDPIPGVTTIGNPHYSGSPSSPGLTSWHAYSMSNMASETSYYLTTWWH